MTIAMTLKKLANQELHLATQSHAERERKTTLEVLWHLREIDRRMLYAEMGYRDLKEYCVKELKYSEGSAWRRISAMKLLMEVPEVETKIETGELNLTQISMAKAHFREVKATPEQKREVLLNLENQSTKITERILAEQKPESSKPELKERPIRGHKLEVTLVLDEEMQAKLEEIQLLLGKQMNTLELFKLLASEKLESLRKQSQKQRARKRTAQPSRSQAAAKPTRAISKITIRKLKERNQYQCQYKDPITGRQCEARHGLQIDHVVPFAKGGSNEESNLQLLCANHNRLKAVKDYGSEKMRHFMEGLG